jgi:ketosteroid isomerase-like protein
MTNLQTVKNLYEAFAVSDRDRILELFSPDIEWIQNEGFPGGGRHVGAQTVLDDVFAKFKIEWSAWRADVNNWLDAGDAIIALGNYHGTHKTTGQSMTAAFAHVYYLKDSRITRFEQYTDTRMVAAAMK